MQSGSNSEIKWHNCSVFWHLVAFGSWQAPSLATTPLLLFAGSSEGGLAGSGRLPSAYFTTRWEIESFFLPANQSGDQAELKLKCHSVPRLGPGWDGRLDYRLTSNWAVCCSGKKREGGRRGERGVRRSGAGRVIVVKVLQEELDCATPHPSVFSTPAHLPLSTLFVFLGERERERERRGRAKWGGARKSWITQTQIGFVVVGHHPRWFVLSSPRNRTCSWPTVFFLFFVFRSPAISLGFTTFWWDFCVCDHFLIQPLR